MDEIVVTRLWMAGVVAMMLFSALLHLSVLLVRKKTHTDTGD